MSATGRVAAAASGRGAAFAVVLGDGLALGAGGALLLLLLLLLLLALVLVLVLVLESVVVVVGVEDQSVGANDLLGDGLLPPVRRPAPRMVLVDDTVVGRVLWFAFDIGAGVESGDGVRLSGVFVDAALGVVPTDDEVELVPAESLVWAGEAVLAASADRRAEDEDAVVALVTTELATGLFEAVAIRLGRGMAS